MVKWKKDQLRSVIHELNKFVADARTHTARMERITTEVCGAIATKPLHFASFYLKEWLAKMLGALDEILILINGEIIRPYHRKIHEKFEHDRGKENFNLKTPLSSCCTDGINFEWRHSKALLSMDSAMDDNDLRSGELTELANQLFNLDRPLKAALVKAGAVSVNISVRRHKEEFIQVDFGQKAPTVLLDRKSAVFKCSRAQALSTTIGDPPESLQQLFLSTRSTSTGALSATTGGSSSGRGSSGSSNRNNQITTTAPVASRKRNRVLDSDIDDDDDDDEEFAADGSKGRKEEEDASEWNVKQIKKDHGVDVDGEDDRDNLDVEKNTTRGLNTNVAAASSSHVGVSRTAPVPMTAISRQTSLPRGVMNNSSNNSSNNNNKHNLCVGIPIPEVRVLKFKIIQPLLLPPPPPQQPTIMSVELLFHTDIVDEKRKSSVFSSCISAAEVLDGVFYSMLIAHRTSLSKPSPKCIQQFMFPTHIQFDKVKYGRGEVINVPPPLENTKQTVLFPLYCESSFFMSQFVNKVLISKASVDISLGSTVELLSAVCIWLLALSSLPMPEQQVPLPLDDIAIRSLTLNLAQWCFSSGNKDNYLQAVTRILDFSTEVLLSTASSSSSSSSSTHPINKGLAALVPTEYRTVDISHSASIFNFSLCKLLQTCGNVIAIDVGLLPEHIAQLTVDLSTMAMKNTEAEAEKDTPTKLSVVRLDLQHNNLFFMSKIVFESLSSLKGSAAGLSFKRRVDSEHAWTSCLEQILCGAPKLRYLDMSYCCRSGAHATALCTALVHALHARLASGLPSILYIRLGGLFDSYPSQTVLLAQQLNLSSSNSGCGGTATTSTPRSTTSVCVPGEDGVYVGDEKTAVRCLDCSGFDLVLL